MDAPRKTGSRAAVIDLGSNSARILLARLTSHGGVEPIAEERRSLQLGRHVRDGRLSAEGITKALEAASDFVALARGAGIAEVTVIGTAALREATNVGDLARALEERLGLVLRVLEGSEEAEYAFRGAVYGLAVTDGLFLDLGGGSLEVVAFEARRAVRSWSLPLGALRLHDAFLPDDPPAGTQLVRLAGHVSAALAEAGVPHLQSGESLAGTGGTLRNLAKVDQRRRPYPVRRVHGYALPVEHLAAITGDLARRPMKRRADLPGLNPARADSILSGAVVIEQLMRWTGATELLVSGAGLREGLLRRSVGPHLPPSGEVRRHASAALATKFRFHDPALARARADLALALLRATVDHPAEVLVDALEAAAVLLDVGSSVDAYHRNAQSAAIILQGGMDGFTHQQLVTAAAITLQAGAPDRRRRRLLHVLDARQEAERQIAAVALALADEVVRRGRPAAPPRVEVRRGAVRLHAAGLHLRDLPHDLPPRFHQSTGLRLEIEGGSG